jgi:hypothetical protein
MALQHLRASTANKRPTPAAMADGQLAINTAATSPGLFFKDAGGTLVKVGPVHVGTTAPNVTPASGGQSGNSIGEQWLDTAGGRFVFKVWDGTAWRTEDGEFVNASGDVMTGALVMDNQQQIRFRETTANGTNFIALQAPASVASDKTITLPDVTGTVVTTGDTGSVTSTMILDGTIVNADVNASAAIAGTKISPDFGSQTVQTTGIFSHALGTATAPTVTFTGDLNTGIYSPGADQVAISTNGTGRLFVDASGRVGIGATPNTTFELTTLNDTVNSNPATLRFRDTDTSQQLGQIAGRIQFYSSDNTGPMGVYGEIRGLADGVNGTGAVVIATGTAGSAIEHFRVGSGGATSLTSDSGTSPLVVNISSTEVARIDSSGRLGLGTSSVRSQFHISGTGQTTANLTDAGSRADMLRLSGIGSTGGQGGAILFANSQSDTADSVGYAAIKGLMTVGSNNTIGDLAFSTRNATTDTALTERVRLTAGGRLGIGTAAPVSRCQIDISTGALSSASATADHNLHLFQTNLASGQGAGIAFSVFASGSADSTSAPGAAIVHERTGAFSSGNLLFKTRSSTVTPGTCDERMRIDSSGRVLIGTSTSSAGNATLQVAHSAAGAEFIRYNTGVGVVGGNLTLGRSKSGTIGTLSAVASGDGLGNLAFVGAGDGSTFLSGANIQGVVDTGTVSATSMPCRLVFSTTADGASSPTERLRITNAGVLQVADAGNISVGTTTGTKIGTATTQKLGFYNATPVVQPTAVADATDAASVITQLNALLSRMRTLGLIAT